MGFEDAPTTTASRFAGWLQASMQHRGLSQAELARSVGVADTQVSRWRRGQVVPTVQYLQRLADTFGIQRVTLDQLVGLPVAQAESAPGDPQREAELQALQARIRDVMQAHLPREMWRAYADACVALAEGLGASASRAVREARHNNDPLAASQQEGNKPPPDRPLGFRH